MRCADNDPNIIDITKKKRVRLRFLSDVTKGNNQPDHFINLFI